MEAEQIQKNWEKHLAIIEKFISEGRKEQVLLMVEALEDKMVLAPASGKSHFHNAFPGGYIDHVNRVVQCSLMTRDLWTKMGADINFTEEELVFSALFHDLGKVGDGEVEGYIRQTDQWRQKNLNEQYTVRLSSFVAIDLFDGYSPLLLRLLPYLNREIKQRTLTLLR